MIKRKPVNGRAKGAKYELDLAAYFVDLGYKDARRMIRTGTVKHADEGDLDGLPFTVQAKDWTIRAPRGITELDLAKILGEAQRQARAKGHSIAVVIEKVARQLPPMHWVHFDLLTLNMLLPGGARPSSLEDAELMFLSRARMRLGVFARLLVRRYPPS